MVHTEVLKDLDCLSHLNDEQLVKIAQIAVEMTFEKDSYVEKQDDVAEALYIVVRGRVAIEIDLPRHRKICIYVVDKGELLGWSAVVPPHAYTASSLCLEKATLLQLPRDPLLELMDDDIRLKASMMETISRIISLRLKDTRLQLSYLLGWD